MFSSVGTTSPPKTAPSTGQVHCCGVQVKTPVEESIYIYPIEFQPRQQSSTLGSTIPFPNGKTRSFRWGLVYYELRSESGSSDNAYWEWMAAIHWIFSVWKTWWVLTWNLRFDSYVEKVGFFFPAAKLRCPAGLPFPDAIRGNLSTKIPKNKRKRQTTKLTVFSEVAAFGSAGFVAPKFM